MDLKKREKVRTSPPPPSSVNPTPIIVNSTSPTFSSNSAATTFQYNSGSAFQSISTSPTNSLNYLHSNTSIFRPVPTNASSSTPPASSSFSREQFQSYTPSINNSSHIIDSLDLKEEEDEKMVQDLDDMLLGNPSQLLPPPTSHQMNHGFAFALPNTLDSNSISNSAFVATSNPEEPIHFRNPSKIDSNMTSVTIMDDTKLDNDDDLNNGKVKLQPSAAVILQQQQQQQQSSKPILVRAKQIWTMVKHWPLWTRISLFFSQLLSQLQQQTKQFSKLDRNWFLLVLIALLSGMCYAFVTLYWFSSSNAATYGIPTKNEFTDTKQQIVYRYSIPKDLFPIDDSEMHLIPLNDRLFVQHAALRWMQKQNNFMDQSIPTTNQWNQIKEFARKSRPVVVQVELFSSKQKRGISKLIKEKKQWNVETKHNEYFLSDMLPSHAKQQVITVEQLSKQSKPTYIPFAKTEIKVTLPHKETVPLQLALFQPSSEVSQDQQQQFVTPFYSEAEDAVFCQHQSDAMYTLIHPFESDLLYTKQDMEQLSIVSALQFQNPHFPLLQKAHPLQVTLKQGECIFVPAFWYKSIVAKNAFVSLKVDWQSSVSTVFKDWIWLATTSKTYKNPNDPTATLQPKRKHSAQAVLWNEEKESQTEEQQQEEEDDE